MHSYTIDLASYNGSTPTPDANQPQADPWVWIRGSVDGVTTAYLPVYWSAIQNWNTFSGVSGVQNFLAWLLLAMIKGPPFAPAPELPFIPTSIPAPITGGSTGTSGAPAPGMSGASVDCVEALVPPWQQ